jgi:hypothetical protein
MPDWKKIVREKLGSLPLTNGRRDEVIEELAQQLESAYEEALAQGIHEQEAMRGSLDQFKDWENLRNEVFQSVEGTHLPIWEQSGIFAPRRWLVWISLLLTVVLFATPTFRQALTIIPIPGRNLSEWNARAFSEKALRRIEQSGDKQKHARALAFVALHSPKEDDLRALSAAEKAMAIDPQLTWISAHVSHATYLVPGYDPKPWIERLKAWDPGNAYVYLLEADASVHADWEIRWTKFSAPNGDLRRALAAEPRWRIPMEKAFSAPRIDNYVDRQFLLDREVLLERGLGRPIELMMASASAQLPDFFMLKTYADHQLLDVGEAEENAGRLQSSLAAYEGVVTFAQKLRGASLEQLLSATLRNDAYNRIIPLLRREGRDAEADAAESELSVAIREHGSVLREGSHLWNSPPFRSGQIAGSLGLILLFFVIASLVWLACVVLLRAQPNLSHAFNWLASRLGWAPLLLPLVSLGLFLSCLPYSKPVAKYSDSDELRATFGRFFAGVSSFRLDPILDVWIDHMFWLLIWSAVIGLLGAVCLRWVARRRRAV